jgi:hypothetical protein
MRCLGALHTGKIDADLVAVDTQQTRAALSMRPDWAGGDVM